MFLSRPSWQFSPGDVNGYEKRGKDFLDAQAPLSYTSIVSGEVRKTRFREIVRCSPQAAPQNRRRLKSGADFHRKKEQEYFMSKRILVIGASACGAKAASRIRRLCPDDDVTLLDESRYISYAACGMPYYLGGRVRAMDDLRKTTYGRIRDAAYFQEVKGIQIRAGLRALHIDRTARLVEAEDVATGKSFSFAYDALVLAMGAAPKTPPIPGAELKGVYHLTRLEDAEALAAELGDRGHGSAVIVGGSFIGVETAEALAARKWSVTMLERESQLFPGLLDFEIAAMIEEHFFENNVAVELNAEILSFGETDGRVGRVITKKAQYDADIVIIAAGLAPRTKLAQAAGLSLGKTGALRVNARMQTDDPAIYAGGDLVENVHLVTGKPCYIPLGSTANKHGRVIADNICGIPSEFPGVQGTFACKAFDYSVGSTGVTEAQAARLHLDAGAVSVCGFDKAHYYPGSQILGLKLIYENGTHRLLGMQAVGKGDAARRIDVAATAIRLGASIRDIVSLDLAYAPPFSAALDVFVSALNVVGNIASGLMKPVDAREAKALLEQGSALMVDVRSALEFERAHIDHPGVVNLPLDELPRRMGELPKDRKIICVCLLGLRGFTAQRMLDGAGFADVHTLEGGMFLWPWKDELA